MTGKPLTPTNGDGPERDYMAVLDVTVRYQVFVPVTATSQDAVRHAIGDMNHIDLVRERCQDDEPSSVNVKLLRVETA
jgi:hypothetical protein